MIDITVKVPEDRVPDFYVMYGRWLSGDSTGATSETHTEAGISAWSPDDGELAKQLWAKFNDRARALFTTLLRASERSFSGQELAELLDIPNGANGVAGVLAWPGRYCKQAGRTICWNVGWSDDGSVAVYWMEGVLADLFGRASRA